MVAPIRYYISIKCHQLLCVCVFFCFNWIDGDEKECSMYMMMMIA